MEPPVIPNQPPIIRAAPPLIPPPKPASQPPVAPRPPKKVNSTSWPIRKLLFGAAACAALIGGLYVVAAVWTEMTREDKPEDYVYLCRTVFEEIPVEGVRKLPLSAAEIEVKVRREAKRMDELSNRCRELAPIAQEYNALLGGVEHLVANAPKGSTILFGLAEGVMGLYTGQLNHVAAGGERALDGVEKLWDATKEVEALLHRKEMLTVQLRDIAPQFSGPIADSQFAYFNCSVSQSTEGFFIDTTKHSVRLVNISGRDLHNCVISVRLSNAKPEAYVNVHFAEVWRNGEARVATYTDDFPKKTVANLTSVAVNVWSRELSFPPMILGPENEWRYGVLQ